MLARRRGSSPPPCLRAARAGRARCTACWAVLAFALLAAYTALSIVWSLAPADSWLEANRTLAYLAVVRRRRSRSCGSCPAAGRSCSTACSPATVIVCAWALLTKVFPAALAADETLARLRAPFEYWNSVGLMAALGVPPLLWLGRAPLRLRASSTRSPGRCSASCCVVPDALLLARRADRARRSALAIWFAAVPLRLRAVAALVARRARRRPGRRCGRSPRTG